MEGNIHPMLLNRDYTLILDRSGSMARPVSGSDPTTRWKSVYESTYAVAQKLTEVDSDGITLYVFSQDFTRFENVTSGKVDHIFKTVEPDGGTALDKVLHDAFFGPEGYITRKKKGLLKANGEFIVIVTDGEPNDKSSVAREIIAVSKMLDNPKELALLFIQVGDDPAAAQYLASLDDDLKGAKYDIVSVIPASKLGNKTLQDVILDAVLEHKVSV